MSRARNLKPAFFKNEQLAELPFEYRLLFEGLWCLADRCGRLEDRPKRIKAEVFPYDDVDTDKGLSELQRVGMILRYSVNETAYIQILTFEKHQNPHCKEADSTIPAPCLHSASTGNTGTSPADSLFLDSLNPIQAANAALSAGEVPADPCPHSAIVAAYHEILPELPMVRTWDADRQKLLRARWREGTERQSLNWWRDFFEYVRRCPFLLGQVQSGDRDPFLADLEWLIRPKNFRKVIEGKYERNAA